MTEERPLKSWVAENLTTDSANQLDSCKGDVASLLVLTKAGDVVPRVPVQNLDAKCAILLQGIGKAYAEIGGYVENARISAPTLVPILGIPSGTVGWALSELRKEHLLIAEGHGEFRISLARIGEAISRIKQKLSE